jgi:hypothetical protein
MDAPAERAARRNTRAVTRRQIAAEFEIDEQPSDDEEFAALAVLAATPIAADEDVDWSVLEAGAEDDA